MKDRWLSRRSEAADPVTWRMASAWSSEPPHGMSTQAIGTDSTVTVLRAWRLCAYSLALIPFRYNAFDIGEVTCCQEVRRGWQRETTNSWLKR